jgi:hypothetical protein
VTAEEVRALFGRILGLVIDASPGPTLDSLGIGDDLARFRLWEYAADEFAERTIAEPDVVELLSARTYDELIETVVQSLSRTRHT